MAGLRPQKGVLHSKALPLMPMLPSGPPQINTRRLSLRPLRLDDAARIQELAGNRAIAENTLLVPHPYEDGMAERWIRGQAERCCAGREVTFGIALRRADRLIGVIGLGFARQHSRAELGYWIGKPYWNRGYATEAAEAVLRYGFETLRLNRICAFHFGRNPASGRVLEKLGMTYEGTRRQHVLKWGTYEDLSGYGMLRTEFEGRLGSLERSQKWRSQCPDGVREKRNVLYRDAGFMRTLDGTAARWARHPRIKPEDAGRAGPDWPRRPGQL